MIIEFVWIEEYGVIKNQGFNFNPNVAYKFNKESGELTRETKNKVPSNFFNISNNTISCISALIGANGTGKTTILEFISRFLFVPMSSGGVMVTEKEVINKTKQTINLAGEWNTNNYTIFNRLEIINTHRSYEGSSIVDNEDGYVNTMSLRILGNLVKDTKLIYYSGETNLEHTNRVYESLLSLSDEYENSLYTDISDISLIANDQRRYRTDKAIYSGENPVLTHRSGETQRFINLMQSEYRNFIPFSRDNLSIGLSFNDIDETFFVSFDELALKPILALFELLIQSPQSEISISQSTIDFIDQLKRRGIDGYFSEKFRLYIRDASSNNFKNHLYHHLLLRHIREQLMETMGELTEMNKLKHFIDLISEIENSFTNAEPYTEQIKSYLSTSGLGLGNIGTLDLEASESFCNNLQELDLWKSEVISLKSSQTETLRNIISALETFDKHSGLKYKASTIIDLNIRGLSTGEKQFLKILSRFVRFNLDKKSTPKPIKHFIILIDEFEMGFHPLWQKKFLKTWIEFLEKFINQDSNDGIRVQLIITSHSPFVVSDLPKDCVTFLSKKKDETYSKVDELQFHKETFGGNIHELFTDSFFLEDGLMGDFAHHKIADLIKEINIKERISSQEFQEVYKNRIEMIGEPFLKTKLFELIASKSDNTVIDAIIEARTNEIENLKKYRKEDRND